MHDESNTAVVTTEELVVNSLNCITYLQTSNRVVFQEDFMSKLQRVMQDLKGYCRNHYKMLECCVLIVAD